VVLPILDGLELVHNAGFIHRDIKPDNIHIRDDGSPVLLDFGSARHSMGHARTVTILVAPGYAPFEQYYSSGENQGPWTDLYSLGATCYRAIAGIAPMDAISRSKGILGSTREILVPAATIGSGRYSASLLKAIDHALQFAEKDRPQNIAEWRRELTGAGTLVARASPATMSVKPATAPEPLPVAAASAPATSIRGPVIWAALGALVATLVVVGGVRLLPKQKPEPDPEKEQTTKLLAELQRSEARRVAEEEKRKKEMETAARVQRDEQQKREAEQRTQAEQQRKLADERARRDMESRKNAEAAKAQREADAKRSAEAQKKAEEDKLAAQRRREEDARRAGEARKAEETKSAAVAVAVPKPSAPAAPPGAELLAQAEQAAKRGNEAESVALYRKAANAGNPDAQYRLGEMSAAGKGVSQSNLEAYIWFSLAANGGHAGARSRRDQVVTKLQPAEIQQADRLIRARTQGGAPPKS
jgi:hypothetical protein